MKPTIKTFVATAVIAIAFSGVNFGIAQASTLSPLTNGCNLVDGSTPILTGATSCRENLVPNTGGNITEASLAADRQPSDPDYIGFGDLSQTWHRLGEAEDFPGTIEKPIVNPFEFTFTATETAGVYEWALNPLLRFAEGAHYVFAIKGPNVAAGSPFNIAYLMDGITRSGTFTDSQLVNEFSLSNVRLFGTAKLDVVPLPAAAWLLLTGLGGLALLRRRRKIA